MTLGKLFRCLSIRRGVGENIDIKIKMIKYSNHFIVDKSLM